MISSNNDGTDNVVVCVCSGRGGSDDIDLQYLIFTTLHKIKDVHTLRGDLDKYIQ